jgi:pilus assembly protein CpaE
VAHDAQITPTPAHGGARKLRVLLLADGEDRASIRKTLDATEEPRLEIREGASGAKPEKAHDDATDVVMFVFASDHQAANVPFNGVESGKGPVRIALMHERSPNAVRTALRAGADEVLFLPLDHGEVTRALLKISEIRLLHQAVARARLISLVSVTGGVGVTTIATNCALALAHSTEKKVAIIDMDYQSADLEAALNVEPEHGILDLCQSELRLNSVQVESALTRHQSGVYLLAAPRRIEEGEQITARRLTEVLSMLREMVDVVIVDVGRHINDASVAVWENSDELAYVIDQSIGAIRGSWRFLDLFSRLNLPSIHPKFVLNRWMPHHSISEKHIINTLGRPLLARIPRDDDALQFAHTRGEDLWKAAPRSALVRSFEDSAAELCGLTEGRVKRPGLFQKILGRNGKDARS